MFSLSFVRKRVVAGLVGFALLGVCSPGWAGANAAESDAAGFDAAVREVRAVAKPDAGRACIPSEECCKVCVKGRACGNTCIKAEYQCHKGRGCACDADEVCD